MKILLRTRYSLWLFALLFGIHPAVFGFQLADGTSPSPNIADKYIFYWGNIQADLTQANNYHAVAQITVQAFRQMLLRPPHLWNGSALVDRISFRLDDQAIAATRNTQDYLSRLGWMDETFSKPAVAGQILHLTDLRLDEYTTGSIDLTLTEPEKTNNTQDVSVRSLAATNSLNTRFLKQAIWGREDIHDTSNRDFFTVGEFWQTIGQIPIVDWQPYVIPVEVAASIQIRTPELATQAFSTLTESKVYLGTLETMRNYKHLVRPGTTITLTLKTLEQHDPLYEKSLNIVADNDPRLTLRRKTDTQIFQIKWGGMDPKITNLYLLELKDAQGNQVPVDAPSIQRFSLRKADLEATLALRPEFWVNGQPLHDVSFRITTPVRSVDIGPDQPMPDSLAADLAFGTNSPGLVQLNNLRAPGYDLSAIEYSLSTMESPLPLRNSLEVLQIAPVSLRIKLSAPVEVAQMYEVEVELPEATFARLNAFEPDGWVAYSEGMLYAAGKHKVAVPRSAFRHSGKHILILNTQIGVAKVEFEVR